MVPSTHYLKEGQTQLWMMLGTLCCAVPSLLPANCARENRVRRRPVMPNILSNFGNGSPGRKSSPGRKYLYTSSIEYFRSPLDSAFGCITLLQISNANSCSRTPTLPSSLARSGLCSTLPATASMTAADGSDAVLLQIDLRQHAVTSSWN